MIRLFEGYEAEGRFRGVKTLFVSGNVPFEKIRNYADVPENLASVCMKYGQIYFGADHCSEINWAAVAECTKIVPIVTVELGPDNLPPSIAILLHTFVHPIVNISKMTLHEQREILQNISHERTQVKFETETKCYLAPIKSFLQNWKIDIQKDKELWRQE